jgi:putative SOS response-associated peptidase YedK
MCYDLSFAAEGSSIFDYFPELLEDDQQLDFYFDKTYHKIGMSYPQWPVIVNEAGKLKLEKYNWGPIPKMLNTLEKVKKQRQYYLNARSEKILEKGTMWNAIRHQRCLIAATGYFEHREVPGLKRKVPYYIHVKDRKIFFIAGLFAHSNSWDVDKPERIPTFTLITRPANEILGKIHNSGEFRERMPLILPASLEREWLNPHLTDLDIQEILHYQLPADQIEYDTVSPVRVAKADDENVIAHVEYPGVTPL